MEKSILRKWVKIPDDRDVAFLVLSGLSACVGLSEGLYSGISQPLSPQSGLWQIGWAFDSVPKPKQKGKWLSMHQSKNKHFCWHLK